MLTCSNCGHPFQQIFDPTPRKGKKPETEEGEEKLTLNAAKSNGQGPFCELCRHLEMALRYAEHRGLRLTAAHITRAQRQLIRNTENERTTADREMQKRVVQKSPRQNPKPD